MSSAEQAVSVARDAVGRVLGIDASALRADTPLTPLAWDSLACVCWSDAVAEAGWLSDSSALATASSIGDLAASITAPEARP